MAIYHTLIRTVKENPQTGSIISDAIMDPATLGKGVKMFAQVTLKPGCAVPIHQHVGNKKGFAHFFLRFSFYALLPAAL